MTPPELLLGNRLEKDIQKILYPMHLVLSFFFLSKYSVKDDYITPQGKKFYFVAFFCLSFLYGLSINRLFFGELEDTMGINNNDIVTITFAFFFIFFCAGFTILFILNIVHRDININIILLIQNIYKDLNFSGSLSKVVRWNWITILSAIIMNIFLNFLYSGIFNEFKWDDLVLEMIFIAIDINLVHGILVILLLRKFLEKWIEDVLGNKNSGENTCIHLFGIYRNILEAYNIFKKIFQILVRFSLV